MTQSRSYRMHMFSSGRAPALLCLLCLLVGMMAPVAATTANNDHANNKEVIKRRHEKKKQDLEEKREEIQRKIDETRRKERSAYHQLNRTKKELSSANAKLRSEKRKMDLVDRKMVDTQTNLKVTETWSQRQEALAGKRLREMYEGHRLSFLEMIFQTDSLQQLIDRMYYQTRIAEQDKNLLDKLKAQAQALAANRSRLDQQRSQLGSLVSEISKKAQEFASRKSAQERVAEKLRSQRSFYEKTERQLEQQSRALETQIQSMEDSVKSESNEPLTKGSGRFAMPLKAKLTSPFGWRRHPIFRTRKFHTGIDLAGPRRSPIRASDSGHVIHTGWYGGYGKVVILSHGNGYSTLYAHLTKATVSKGQNVSKGDVIGYEGSTGFATGPHLHFEVRVQGKPKNPLNYVK
ncbi:MAG TPA: peptidoglycan DD-metalloendopeptidase family protein [Candidatus Melainabacteria bacterium]|nr:peptidoglycan DD-metalloendopeptidase family protein [Candidatus Melainabacteria bacterium]